MGTMVMIYGARLAFPTLGVPEYFQGKKQRENDQRRWSASGIVVPGETKASRCNERGIPLLKEPQAEDAKALIDKIMLEVATAKWGAKAAGAMKAIQLDPKACFWLDGDRKPDYQDYPGNWVAQAHRREGDGRPMVIDSDGTPIFDEDGNVRAGKAGRIYSGCYVNLHVEIWPQDNASGKAMRAGLLGVQRYAGRVGDSFGGARAPVANAFEAVTEGASADDLGDELA